VDGHQAELAGSLRCVPSRGLTRARATASWSDRPATLKYERKNAYGQVRISHVVERPEGFRSDGRDAGFNLFHGRHYALQSTIKRPRWRPLCLAVSRPLIAGRQLPNPESKAVMMRIAADYDRLAERARARADEVANRRK